MPLVFFKRKILASSTGEDSDSERRKAWCVRWILRKRKRKIWVKTEFKTFQSSLGIKPRTVVSKGNHGTPVPPPLPPSQSVVSLLALMQTVLMQIGPIIAFLPTQSTSRCGVTISGIFNGSNDRWDILFWPIKISSKPKIGLNVGWMVHI